MLATNSIRFWIVFIPLIGIFSLASWLTYDTIFHATSDYEFCTSCHSHKPIGTSYLEDVHGGNNAVGFRATCSQCHIPQDNSFNYLWVKSLHGVIDPTMELLKDPHDIDWHGHREKRESYTYDSGCLSCHKFLQEKTLANTKAFLPHRRYFLNSENQQDSEKLSCVGCHKHVGHKNLGLHLEQHGWKNSQNNETSSQGD